MPLINMITANVFAIVKKAFPENPLKSKIRVIPTKKSMQLKTKKKGDFNEITPLKKPFIISKIAIGKVRNKILYWLKKTAKPPRISTIPSKIVNMDKLNTINLNYFSFIFKMCEHCIKHAGNLWYFKPKSYSKNRNVIQRLISDNLYWILETVSNPVAGEENIFKPELSRIVFMNAFFSYPHTGQVIPLEHTKEVLRKSYEIALGDCMCRKIKHLDYKDKCLFINRSADSMVRKGGGKFIDIDKAINFVDYMKNNCYFSVWTGPKPFVACICSCNSKECAIHSNDLKYFKKPMSKGLFIAEIDKKACNNCGLCKEKCEWGAIDIVENKILINDKICSGCGMCRGACRKNAINLVLRIKKIMPGPGLS